MHEERRSSRLGQNSQPQPLSHSLLSQLELSENDPNTFRDIIDDLTVQKKKLRRQLKRYKRIHDIGKGLDGLFEIRLHNLPPEKKHELETVLQDFASNMHRNQSRSIPESVVPDGHSLPPQSAAKHTPEPPAPQFTRTSDSAYASISATNVTAQTVSGLSERSRIEVYNQAQAEWVRTPHSLHPSPQALQQDPDTISDQLKQEVVVKRLEQLFINGTDDLTRQEPENAMYRSSETVQLGGLRGEELPSSLTSRPREKSFSIPKKKNTWEQASIDRGQEYNTVLPTTSFPAERLDWAEESDRLGYLQQLRVASPVAEGSSDHSQEWRYLNLLVNMAQLHTLSVTPEYVRQAIRNSSTRLILSEDGRKIRWHRDILHPGLSSENPPHRAVMDDLKSDSAHQSQQAGEHGKLRQSSSPRNETSASRAPQVSHLELRSRKLSATRLQYKPIFIHRKRAPTDPDQANDGSTESDDSSSADEQASTASNKSQAKAGPRINGTMIFLNHSPVFLDLSAEPREAGCIDNPSYESLASEPLGRRGRTSRHPNDEDEGRPAFSVIEPSWGSTATPFTRGGSPPLNVYDSKPASPSEETTSTSARITLEASGIGGIQLEDNFAIDVALQHPPSSRTLKPSRYHDTYRNRIMPSSTANLQPPSSHPRIVSTTTSHLPPSPLPPPSYVYPAFSSSSSNSESDDGLLDDEDGKSVEDLRFRPMSLSPQMRMFLEGQSEADASGSDDD